MNAYPAKVFNFELVLTCLKQRTDLLPITWIFPPCLLLSFKKCIDLACLNALKASHLFPLAIFISFLRTKDKEQKARIYFYVVR